MELWIVLLIVLGVLALIVVVLALWLVGTYNRLVTLRNRNENAFSQIDVQLKRRYDLIPNLVESAKGYMAHERETLDAVISARNQAMKIEANIGPGFNPADITQLAQAEGALTGALGRLMAVMEAYPDLKANQNVMAVQEELTSTENKIAFARQAFNDSVTTYETYRESFPPVIIAPLFGFKEAAVWEIDDQAQREAPKVNFN
ncbi:LemA family protein [Mucisphaera calidilacus]|uniref:LemA family protein n=1 Tax=Mucisphaera calidilacus TaxID=2527982 RepID=A0A518BZ25_9BACT|nr:LemA family protein [Mucisphaera calidilacus]QDU72232.1 LemA family protein [Mucisphaera calidilacus]